MSARHLSAGTLVATVVAALFAPIAWAMFVVSGDFRYHLDLARQLYETGRPAVPHFLFHGVTAVAYAALSLPSFLSAGVVTITAMYFLTGALAYAVFWRALRESGPAMPWLIALVSLAALLAQPLTLASAYTIGYLWPEPYLSPTYSVMKPFALGCFALTGWCLARERAAGPRLQALFAGVTVACALSKPNFLICVLPAAAILMAYRLWRRLPVSTGALIVGLYAPAALVLTWQFLAAFAGAGESGGMYRDSISWAPLKFMRYWATGLPAKFVASTLFPAVSTALYWPHARRDTWLQCGWLCFAFGAVYSYGFVETRNWHTGNFVWSGYITTFTLFVASAILWMRQAATAEGTWPLTRAIVCGAVLGLHMVSGVRLTWLYLTGYGCRAELPLGFLCG